MTNAEKIEVLGFDPDKIAIFILRCKDTFYKYGLVERPKYVYIAELLYNIWENIIMDDTDFDKVSDLTNGSNIVIDASILNDITNNNDNTTKHITLNLKKDSLIYILLQKFLIEEFNKTILSDDEEFTNKNLNESISYCKLMKILQGRNNNKNPMLGSFVEWILQINNRTQVLDHLTLYEKYCCIADLLFYSRIYVPKEFQTFEANEEDWCKKPNKEKYDLVKSWVNSFQNIRQKHSNLFNILGLH